MDLRAITEQIRANLDQFDNNEKRIIILQLLNFIKELETEKEELQVEKEEVLHEVKKLKQNQLNEESLKAKVDEIIDLANEEAERIKEQAIKDGETHLSQMKEQGRSYMYEFLERLKEVVIELQKIDDEAKAYRMHILTAFRNTLYKFADSGYHMIKLEDHEIRELIQLFNRDATLQQLTDQMMERLHRFENYLTISKESSRSVDPEVLQQYLQQVVVIDEPNIEQLVVNRDAEITDDIKTLKEDKTLEEKPKIHLVNEIHDEDIDRNAEIEDGNIAVEKHDEVIDKEKHVVTEDNTIEKEDKLTKDMSEISQGVGEVSIQENQEIDVKELMNHINESEEELDISNDEVLEAANIPEEDEELDREKTYKKFLELFNQYTEKSDS